jgi:hypothetical protein
VLEALDDALDAALQPHQPPAPAVVPGPGVDGRGLGAQQGGLLTLADGLQAGDTVENPAVQHGQVLGR